VASRAPASRAKASGGGGGGGGGSSARRFVWIVGGVAVLWYAVQGGEYGTSDLWRMRAKRLAVAARIDSLTREVDSLRVLAHAIETDPAVQERIAREEFGMVRGDKELLYRFAPTEGSHVQKH
jgi:cell division protein FtsB